jgi:hypothetical protein
MRVHHRTARALSGLMDVAAIELFDIFLTCFDTNVLLQYNL